MAITHVLANNAPLISAIESIGNLDNKPRLEGMELLCCGPGRDQERLIVIATQDHQLCDVADQVLWLEDSQLPENTQIQLASN